MCPRFFYGYIILALCLANMVVMRGVTGSFSVYYLALLENFPWTHSDGASIASTYMPRLFSVKKKFSAIYCSFRTESPPRIILIMTSRQTGDPRAAGTNRRNRFLSAHY